MSFVFLNDQIVPLAQAQIGLRDLTLLRGYGIFDFLRTWQGQPLFLEAYLNRFYASAEKMGLSIPLTKAKLPDIIQELLILHAYPESGIRLLLTGGQSSDALSPGVPTFCIFIEPFHEPVETNYIQGIKVLSCAYQRFMPEIKSINYHPLVYMRNELKRQGATDLLYHMNGQVSELSRCNIFYVKKGEIYTNEEGILNGITRQKVLELTAQNYSLHLGPITLDDLYAADEVFLSSTTKKVMPIVQIDNHLINKGKVGSVSRELKMLLLEMIGRI